MKKKSVRSTKGGITITLAIQWRRRHVAKGGSEGADEPPFFSDKKKKKKKKQWRVWQLRVPGAIAPACTTIGLRLHGPEPNLESVAV